MKISDPYNPYSVSESNTIKEKPTDEKEYARRLMSKYPCLSPGKNASVSITGGLLRKAMKDEKTGEWLERELSKAPDYIKQAQQSAIAHGSTLKYVSIEFGEEYSTMCTLTATDGGGTDSDIDKWLERIKKKKEELKAEEKKQEEERAETRKQEAATYKMELKGTDLADLTRQFTMNLADQVSLSSSGTFDVRG